MKRVRRIVCALLALAMTTAFAPAGLANALPALAAYADEAAVQADYTISSAEDWAAFVSSGPEGGTVSLTQDITLGANASSVILSKSSFSGVFDGGGHTITLADGSHFEADSSSGTTQSIGLFLELSGTVQNLNIQLAGNVMATSLDQVYPTAERAQECITVRHAGVVVGEIRGGTVSRVAVLGGTFRFVANRDLNSDANLGGIVGDFDSGTISECFTSCSLEGWFNSPDNTKKTRVGGIVGYMGDASGTATKIEHCVHADGSIRSLGQQPNVNNHTSGLAGGLVAETATTSASGTPFSISNCIVYNTQISVGDIGQTKVTQGMTWSEAPVNTDWMNGTVGYVCALPTSGLVQSQCYASGITFGTHGVQNTSGVSTNEADAKQALVGSYPDVWTTTGDGHLGLLWMYARAEIALSQTGGDVNATVTLPDSATAGSQWQYTATANLMGRYGTPAAPTGTIGSAAAITETEIVERRTGTGSAYYTGGVYQFDVNVTGKNLPERVSVTWEVEDDEGNRGASITAASIDPAGKLTVAYGYYGRLIVHASVQAGEATGTARRQINVSRPALTIKDPENVTGGLYQGQTYDFSVEWTDLYYTQGQPTPAVQWSVSGNGNGGTSIDESTGVLTVGAGERVGARLTVTASQAGAQGAQSDTVSFTVLETGKEHTVTLTPSSSGETAAAVEMTVGDTLTVTVDTSGSPEPDAGYELEEDTGEPVMSQQGTAVSTSDAQSPYTYTAVSEGSVTLTATRTFEQTPETQGPAPGTDESSSTGESTSESAEAGDGSESTDEAARSAAPQSNAAPAGAGSGAAGVTPLAAGDAIVWTSTLSVTVSERTVPVADDGNDSAVSLEPVNGAAQGPAVDNTEEYGYTLAFPDAEEGRRYQITASGEGPSAGGEGWRQLAAGTQTVELDNTLTAGFSQEKPLYLWMYRAASGQMSASEVVGYELTPDVQSGVIVVTPMDEYPAAQGVEGRSGVTGTWTVTGNQSPVTFSVLEKIKEANAPALDGFSSLATGEVRVTVQQVAGQLYEGDAPIVSASVAIGDAALRPTITPRGNEVLPDNSFTIESSGQAGTIYYKIFAGQTGVPSTETVTPGENGWEQYTPGTAVHYPGNYTAVTVAAVSYVTGGLPSEMDVVTYTTANLITPAAPQLRMGDRQDVFSPGSTYTDGETFYFLFDKTQTGWQQTENEVYYTLNGRDPVPGSEGYRYDESAPPALDFGLSNQLVIKAVTYDPELGAMSEVATFTVQRRVTVGRPVASVGSGETVRNGEAITLELPESFVDMMSDLLGIEAVEYAEYSAGSDVFSRYDSYTRASNSDEPIEGVRYLLVDTGESYSSSMLPLIRYALDDSALEETGRSYQYAVCQVWYSYSDGQTVNYIRFTNPDEISISGEAGSSVTLRAAVFAPEGATSYEDGEEASFAYTIRGIVATPTAVPSTDTQGSTTVKVGDRIALTSDPDTKIFYTTNGSQPRVEWTDEGWQAASEYTMEYSEGAAIRVTSDESLVFIIHAIAVSVDDTLENSTLATFVYTIEELPQAAAPTATPATDAANPTQLAQGEKISLHTTTLNTNIYYTTDGSVPSYAERDAWDAAYAAAAETGTDEETGRRWYMDGGEQVFEPATRIYDVQQGITMQATQDQQIFVVTALVREHETETPKTRESDAVSFVYQLAKVDAPVAAPATEAGTAAVIEPGSLITLTTGTVGAKIYYTTDTTLPDVTDTDAVEREWNAWSEAYEAAKDKGNDANGVRWYMDGGKKQYEPSTKPYDAAQGITMPENVTTFFTIRALALTEDGTHAESDVVTFSYQQPAPVQAVYASPVDGTAVEYGADVTLNCSTEDAQIFYKIFTSEPDEDDVPVVNQDLSYTEPIRVTREVWIRALAVRQGVKSVVTTYHYTVAPRADAPTVSLPTGSVVFKGTRVQLSGEGTIVYTTDGSDPKTSETVQYGQNVNLDGDYGATVTVRAYIQRDGYTPSDTVSFSYTICGEEDYLIASVESGSTVADGTSLTLSTSITNGRIFYTTNGSTPAVSNVYTAAEGKNYTTYEWRAASGTTEGSSLTITGEPDTAFTVKAIVVANGSDGSTVGTFTYKMQPQAAAPTASIPTGAIVLDGAVVELTAPEGVIHYTTDGTTPTTSSPIYSQPIAVDGSASTVLRAIAVVEGKAASEVAVFRYSRAGQAATPRFSVTPGEIDTGTTVAITSDTQNATIYYSTDGTEPSADNLQSLSMYVAPLSITRAVTIKAIAVGEGMDESDVATATYTVRAPAPAESEAPQDTQAQTTVTDRLTSRRTYNSAGDGPTYSDIVLRESACNTVLSAREGNVPENALLTVSRVNPGEGDEATVNSSLNQTIALVYETQLTVDGETVEPLGEVEIGFAIPAEYQNGIVTVSRINDDGTLTQFSARRSGGIAYIQTDTMGRYAISVPQPESEASAFFTYLMWGGGAALAVLALLLLLAWRRRRREGAEGENTGAPGEQTYENLEDFQNFQ